MFGYAEREIMTYGHCEILRLPPQYEMKFAHIREANISHAAGVFHISQKYFTCPQGQISLKKALLGVPAIEQVHPKRHAFNQKRYNISVLCRFYFYIIFSIT